MKRNDDLTSEMPESPMDNWFLPAILMIMVYTVLLRYWRNIAEGYEDELLPLEALSRVIPALALLCLHPFMRKSVNQTLSLAERQRLWWISLGYLLLFTQESDWMTFVREPYLIGRLLFTLLILRAWLALFTAFATSPQDLFPLAPRSREIWTLLFAMGCLIASQTIDLVLDSAIYNYGLQNIELSQGYSALESMLELLFFVGMLHVTLIWIAKIEPRVAQRLFHVQLRYNVILSLIIGFAIGFTQWRHGEPAPMFEMTAGWLVASGALGIYIWSGRRNGLL